MILGDEEVDDVWFMVLVSVLACVWFNYSASIDGELGFQQHYLLVSVALGKEATCLLVCINGTFLFVALQFPSLFACYCQ